MNKKWILIMVGSGIWMLFAVAVWLATPQTCLACGNQVAPVACGANLSAVALKQGDTRKEWWNIFDPRPDNTMNVYLGLNNNQGTSATKYQYQIDSGGDWTPINALGVLTPTHGSGTLGGAGTSNANQTIQISVPYSPTASGTLVLTATLTSDDGLCIFPSAPITTTVQIQPNSATLWPINSRICPLPGQKPDLTFGLRNATDKPKTYSLQARTVNPRGGSASDLFKLEGASGEITLPPRKLNPGSTEQVKLTCETFGYCLTGGENRVELKATPDDGGETALAASTVTIRDPNASCPEPSDFWFLMSPLLGLALVGIPAGAIAGPLAGYWAYNQWGKKPPPSPSYRPPTSRPGGGAPVIENHGPKPRGKESTHGRERDRPKRNDGS